MAIDPKSGLILFVTNMPVPECIRHLNPFSARAKASKSGYVLALPSSKKYQYRRLAASSHSGLVYKKSSKKVMKHHIKQK